MSKQEIIEQTVQLLKQLPEEKAAEIRDFAAFLVQRRKPAAPSVVGKSLSEMNPSPAPARAQMPRAADAAGGGVETEDVTLAQHMGTYVESSPVFAFLHDPAEDVYTLDDLKVRYQ